MLHSDSDVTGKLFIRIIEAPSVAHKVTQHHYALLQQIQSSNYTGHIFEDFFCDKTGTSKAAVVKCERLSNCKKKTWKWCTIE